MASEKPRYMRSSHSSSPRASATTAAPTAACPQQCCAAPALGQKSTSSSSTASVCALASARLRMEFTCRPGDDGPGLRSDCRVQWPRAAWLGHLALHQDLLPSPAVPDGPGCSPGTGRTARHSPRSATPASGPACTGLQGRQVGRQGRRQVSSWPQTRGPPPRWLVHACTRALLQ